jgi:hypothetical protein
MSPAELIEQVRLMNTAEKRAFLEKLCDEFGEELGLERSEPAAELTPEQIADLDRSWKKQQKEISSKRKAGPMPMFF